MSQLPHILFVDDEPHVLSALQRSLREFRDLWQITVCDNPYQAIELIAATAFDTIVTDIRMPGMDGFELLGRIRSMPHREDVPVIVLTGNSETDLKRRALDLGATDLLNKPVATQDLVARLRSALRIKQQQDQLKVYATQLERLVDQRTRELADSRLDILWRLGKAAEQRDEDTGHHIVRVSLYSRVLAESLRLPTDQTETLFVASPLHDVGKIGIPDHILLKPGRLDDAEYATMRRHTIIGAAILRDKSVGMAAYLETSGRVDSEGINPLLEAAAEIAMTHHERWDGGPHLSV